jgi:DNA-binding response OmpR family regulator
MKKILVVEDEKPMAKAMQLKLQHNNFKADIAEDGEEAIKMIEGNGYDLVLLDLVLPKKDGFIVLEEMKKRKIKTPIIVSSNLSQEEDMEKAKKLGALDYFVKANVSLSEVVGHVKKALKI